MPQDEQDRPGSGTGPGAGSAGAPAPVCYRHADRETHVRCSRCDRPICPDCMVSAAVGFQCPQCVREGNKSVREPRTVLGGRVSAQSQTGQLTKAIIGINVVVFLLAHLGGDAFVDRLYLVGKVGYVPSLGAPAGVAHGEWYRLVTAAFLHQQPLHLLINMWALWVFGPTLEALLGRLRFASLYLLCALGGSAASYAFSAANQPSLGASGAIFGLFGAMLVIGRRLQYDIRTLVVLLVFNLAIGFYYSGSIDWRAHLGGLATGLVLGFAFAHAPSERRTLVHTVAQVGALVVVLAVVVVRTSILGS